MEALVGAHLLFLGLWAGLVMVEIVFEMQMFRGQLSEVSVAVMHRITDRFMELPILAGVLITGWLLWQGSDYSDEYLTKVVFGLGAVFANVICYIIVELRASIADRILNNNENSTDLQKLHNYSIALVATIAPGLLSGAIALYIGGLSIGWW